jgi:ligand-binding sensor domain-containing protein
MSDLILKTATNVLDIRTSPCHVYVATGSGLDIFDKDTYTNLAYAFTGSAAVTCLAVDSLVCDNNVITLGTNSSGVLEVVYSGLTSTTGDISNLLYSKYTYPTIPSNEVKCLNRDRNGNLLVGTTSGIVFIEPSGTVYSGVVEDIDSCYLSTSGDAYFSIGGSGIYVQYGPISSAWSYSYYLDTTTTPALPSNTVNNIALGLTTASGIEVFLATSSGLVSYSENRVNIALSILHNYTAELQSSGYDVYGLSLIDEANTAASSGALYFSTSGGSGVSGTVAHFNIVAGSGSVVEKYSSVYASPSGSFESISGATVLAVG